MSRLIFSDLAILDLQNIWHYSAEQWSIKQADRYVQVLRKSCRDLATKRRTGVSAFDVEPDYFRLFCGSHTIYYRRLQAYGIEVIRILHQSMDATSHLTT